MDVTVNVAEVCPAGIETVEEAEKSLPCVAVLLKPKVTSVAPSTVPDSDTVIVDVPPFSAIAEELAEIDAVARGSLSCNFSEHP